MCSSDLAVTPAIRPLPGQGMSTFKFWILNPKATGKLRKASRGVRKPVHFPGRLFKCSTIRRTSSFCTPRKSSPLGRYSQMSPFVFSFVPRSQGLWGWAKYTGSPGQRILPCAWQTPCHYPPSGCGTPAHQADGSGQPAGLHGPADGGDGYCRGFPAPDLFRRPALHKPGLK